MPAWPIAATGRPGPGLPAPDAATRRARWLGAVLTLLLAAGPVAAFAAGLEAAVPALAALAVAAFALNALWLAAGASGALLGVVRGRPAPVRVPAPNPASGGRCAVLWLICGEPAAPVARRIAALRHDLRRTGLAARCDIFVLSDTRAGPARSEEAHLLRPDAAVPALHYRNRANPEGRKPGNVADWVRSHGAGYDTMLVLDADSGIGADRLARLLVAMDDEPALGLIQPGIRLRSGTSRLAAVQRLSGRLCGPAFLRGLAAWAGPAGNFWGHNALIRVRAFAGAAGMAPLPGRAPRGGPVLSHDFAEAARLVRAGWAVRILPETRGSFEDAPQGLADFHRRDRRWCQGNLQHLRLITAPGLHPASRLHLAAGIQGYLAAPLWLGLVTALATGAVVPGAGAALALAAVAGVLLLPKAAALAARPARARRGRAGRVLGRALVAELGMTTLLAPLVMVRQTGAVLSVLAGRDSGWTPAGAAGLRRAAIGLPEAAVGVALTALALSTATGPAALMIAPVAGPLLAAPILVRWFDAAPRRRSTPRALPDATPLPA